jgi:proteasome alpha subunit
MSMPYYVAPEQAMKDRADFARKGISRGRALVALRFENGIVLVAENASQSLRKVSEIYDRIAFAGVGKYNEFDQLRVAGIRSAELTGYQYSRDDVDARGLANDYAQLLGNSFTHGMKPMEVEILVAEVGIDGGHDDQIFHIMYDGTVIDRPDTCALGGESDAISTRLQAGFSDGLSLGEAIKLGVSALSGSDRELSASSLEIALLERNGARRCFRRLEPSEVDAVLQE